MYSRALFLVSILVFLLLSILKSQTTTFEYSLISPNDEWVYDIYESEDGSIIFCGSVASTENKYKRSILVVKIDNIGNLIDSTVYSINGRSMIARRFVVQDNNSFVLFSMISDTLITRNETAIGLYNLDLELNLFNETIYNFDSIYLFEEVSATILSNNNILASISLRIHPSGPRSYSYEFNSSFDSIRARYYPEGSRIISHLHELPNSNIWTLNMLLFRYELIDSDLNIISTQKVPNSILSNYGIAWDTDTTFYLVGHNTDYYPEPYNLSFIKQQHPMDTAGHIYNYWRSTDTLDYPAAWNGISLNNKDSIYIGGTANLDFYSPWYGNQPSWFVVLQTDSLLNLRWERFYGGDAYYVMSKIITSSDGGCIVAGQRYDYLNTTEEELDIVIIKLNSEGLLTSTRKNPTIEMHEAIIYPNPGSEVINVRIATQYKQSFFELFDINGRYVLKQDFTGTQGIVNTTFLEHGTYIYRITSNDGLFESGKWVKQ